MIKKFLSIFSIIIMFSCVFNSCKTKLVAENDFLPEIINPTIESYNYGTEKGYKVSFETSDSNFKPTGVVVYKIKSDLNTSDTTKDNYYEANVIHQTQKLQDYTPKKFNQPNGVLFKIDDTYYLKKVNFKKK